MTSSALLVEPAYAALPEYVHTLGPEVADLAELAGFAPDPEQRLALDAAFALDAKGKTAAFEVCVVCSRQNMKTGFFKQCALGWLYVTDQRLIVWSAHEFRTAQEAFRDMTELVESSDVLSRRVKRIYRGNGDEAIEMMSGQRLIFKARTKSGGRGLSGDKVVLDEGFALQPTHMGALMPTLSARPDPQLLYGSSAGLANSAVLRDIRDRGRRGGSRLAYLEWCAPTDGCADRNCSHRFGTVDGCALDDVANWRAANPALGRRISADYIAAEREALPPEEFARERLGWWDEPGAVAPAFGAGQWEACAVAEAAPSTPVSVGVAVSVDRAWSSIGAASPSAGGRVHVGVSYDKDYGVDRRRGTSWLVERVKVLQTRYDCSVVIDGHGPTSVMIGPLEDAGVRVTVAGTNDVLDACADLYDKVQGRRVSHGSYAELNEAVMGAQPRPVGDRWMWGRKRSVFDVSMLEAVTLALWGATADRPSAYEDRGMVTL